MRTVYLQRRLSINGRSALGGRQLVDRLRRESEALLLGHLVYDEEAAACVGAAVRPDVISESQLLTFAPDVILLEGGLFAGTGTWKVDTRLAEDFVSAGGVMVVADVDLNTLREERSEYQAAAGFLGATANYNGREPVAGLDEQRYWRGHKQILCATEHMLIADWLRPVYDGIPEILCGLPVQLTSWGDLLASGNQDSTEAESSLGPFLEPASLPWASVSKHGAGYVVLMCGLVTSDAWLEGCRHNTEWLVNVCRFVSNAALEDKTRARAVVRSEESLFLSHASPDKPIVSQVLRSLGDDHGVGAWMDERDMLPGDRLPDHISAGIERSTAVIVFWSAAAARSGWVPRELELALASPKPTVLIVRLDDTEVPVEVKDVLRVEAEGMTPVEIGGVLAGTIERRHARDRIEQARRRGAAASAALVEAQQARQTDYPLIASLTRGPDHCLDAPTPTLPEGGELRAPSMLHVINSDYRVDVLCFLDAGMLVTGSGHLSSGDVTIARQTGLIDDVLPVSFPTGNDGHCDDHRPSRRHLEYGYEDVRIIDRNRGRDVVATINCEEHASVCSAAWNPAGNRIVVGSTNYLTIGDDTGHRLVHENIVEFRTNSTAKSVVWQPSVHLMYATGRRLVVADAGGRTLRALTDLTSDVVAVAVSPCCRYLAASGRDGQVVVWSEWGEPLARLKGFGGDGWTASRCLAFSPDSAYLCQAASFGGEGFLVYELATGSSARVRERDTDLIAFHPTIPGVFATAGGKRISFRQLVH